MMFTRSLECGKSTSPTLGSKTLTLNESVFDRLYKAHTVSSKLKCRVLPRVNSITKVRKNLSKQHPLHASAPTFPPPQSPLQDDSLCLKAKPQTNMSRRHPHHASSPALAQPQRPLRDDSPRLNAKPHINLSRRQPLHASAPALAPPTSPLREDVSLRLNATPQTTPLSKPPAISSKLKCKVRPSLIPRLNATPQTTPLSKPPAISSKSKCKGRPSLIPTDVETSSVKSRENSRRPNAKLQTTPLSKPPATSSKLNCRGRPPIVSPDVEKSSTEHRENSSRRQFRAAAPTLASPPIVFIDDSIPLNVTLRTTLLYQKKYDTTAAFSNISSQLVSLNLIQTFVEYEANRMTNREVAANVITALFHRDFPPCDRWEINPSTVEELAPDLFAVEKNATWDWGDNYSVTQAKATIRFGKDEIKVEEYSFFRCWLKIGGNSSKKMYYGFQKKEKDVPSDLPSVSSKNHPSPSGLPSTPRNLPSTPRGLGKVVAQSL